LDVAPQHRPLGGFAVAHRPLGGFAMGRVRTGDLYSLVGTDWTTLPNRLQPGPKLPNFAK